MRYDNIDAQRNQNLSHEFTCSPHHLPQFTRFLAGIYKRYVCDSWSRSMREWNMTIWNDLLDIICENADDQASIVL